MTPAEIRVGIFGVGRVGKDVARILFARRGFSIVGAHSRNPKLVGEDLSALVGASGLPVIRIESDRAAVLGRAPDLVVIATTSFLSDVADDIEASINAGSNVICSAEELAFAWAVDASRANDLDRLARERGVTVLGAGANPGFITDAFLLTIAGAAWQVDSIATRRVVKLTKFSPTILRRLGIGYTSTEFASGIAEGRIFGHIGFPQSMEIVARSLGIQISEIRKNFEPLVMSDTFRSDNVVVEPGRTGGWVQRAEAIVDGRPWFTAEFVGHVDPNSVGYELEDQISINGVPDLRVRVTPGFDPQFTSAGVIANSIRRVVAAPPGLVTVADLPPAVPTPTHLPAANS